MASLVLHWFCIPYFSSVTILQRALSHVSPVTFIDPQASIFLGFMTFISFHMKTFIFSLTFSKKPFLFINVFQHFGRKWAK